MPFHQKRRFQLQNSYELTIFDMRPTSHFPFLIFVSLGRATRDWHWGTPSESPTARRTGFTELYGLDSNTSLPLSPYTSPDCGPATDCAQCLSIDEEEGLISEGDVDSCDL